MAESGVFLHKVVLVGGREDCQAKSGQAYRLCMDFCEVNRWTTVDGYPAPDLQDCLRSVDMATYCSSIDLKVEFHNILIDPDPQWFTGIVT